MLVGEGWGRERSAYKIRMYYYRAVSTSENKCIISKKHNDIKESILSVSVLTLILCRVWAVREKITRINATKIRFLQDIGHIHKSWHRGVWGAAAPEGSWVCGTGGQGVVRN